MAAGRQEMTDRMLWNHSSNLIAAIKNLLVSKESDMVDPREINPYTAKQQEQAKAKPIKAPFSVLKCLVNLSAKGQPNG